MRMERSVLLIVQRAVFMVVVWPPTPASVSRAGVAPTVPVLVTVTTGVLTAVTDVSARMVHCVTPSLEPVSALQDTEAGAVRPSVKWAPMETDASRNASVRMEPPVTMLPENAHAHQDTLELSVKTCVLQVNMGSSVRRDVHVRMEECVTM